MNTISTDLQERIVNAVKHEKNTPQEAVARFMFSPASPYRYLQLDRDLRSLEPALNPPKPPSIRPEDQALLRAQVEANSDAILEEHRQVWLETSGVKVGLTTMHRTLARLGLTVRISRLEIPPARVGWCYTT